MLDMGFVDSIPPKSLNLTPSNVRPSFLCEPYGDGLKRSVLKFQNTPTTIKVEAQEDLKPNIEQFFRSHEKQRQMQTFIAALQPFWALAISHCFLYQSGITIVADWLVEPQSRAQAFNGRPWAKTTWSSLLVASLVTHSSCVRGCDWCALVVLDVKNWPCSDLRTLRAIRCAYSRNRSYWQAGAAKASAYLVPQKIDYKVARYWKLLRLTQQQNLWVLKPLIRFIV